MNAARALTLLRRLRVPAFSTADAAARLNVSPMAATHTLRRLAEAGVAHPICKGLWSVQEEPEALALADVITAPHPAYVSFQSALHLHGMIEQIPGVVYVASLSRTRRIRTKFGTFSIHRIAPPFFGGFELAPRSGAKIATREKALLDVLYLSGTRSRLFATLPELEIPRAFRWQEARRWIARIPAAGRRAMVARRFEALREARDPRRVRGGRRAVRPAR